MSRRTLLHMLTGAALASSRAAAQARRPVLVGIDGEFGLENSTSAQAIEKGVRIAAAQINQAGGLLGGRPLEVAIKDHRSISARGIRNITEFAAMTDVVAVFGGRFSPVIIEQLPLLREVKLPFLAVWSSADAIVENGSTPNYVFRLSLRDSLAMPHMLRSAEQRGLKNVGLLLTNTSWGRSNLAAAQKYAALSPAPQLTDVAWYNWQEKTLVDRYRKLRAGGAEGIVLVANDDEAAVLVREVAVLPPAERVPIISHWGVTGGRLFQEAGPALRDVDFSVIQTFSFFNARKEPLARFLAAAKEFGINRIEDIESPVGVAHAYDMTHILARAITLAGSTERTAVRDAMEKVSVHDGLVKRYAPPFTPTRHEALGPEQLLMARYRADGVLVPATR
ncbi:MAG: ABC transporter substrate-binding protein [Ramlibacter sp.]|nr:ABC transporter substrate-binding protein [Ramlibacter sp.]